MNTLEKLIKEYNDNKNVFTLNRVMQFSATTNFTKKMKVIYNEFIETL